MTSPPDLDRMWADLLPVGRTAASGGYLRQPFTTAERECAAWFREQAAVRGLDLEQDGNGNLIAWWRPDGLVGPGVLTGSHLDSVLDGGAYDGPLGVVTAFAALDDLRARGVRSVRPLGIAVFVEEEGSRFGVACLGSRLATGATRPADAAALTDRDGVRLDDAMVAAGVEPDLGPAGWLDEVGVFVELHVEQGRDLVHRDVPVGMGSAIWPHGRWRLDFTGRADHAGTTRMTDRQDPMLTYAATALAAADLARRGDHRATFGRVAVTPNSTNAIPARVSAWLDARAVDDSALARLVDELAQTAGERAHADGTTVQVVAESVTGELAFDPVLTADLARGRGDRAAWPVVPTMAGHDAGVLAAAGVSTAMLFVRNPTGVSHSPAETASAEDCHAGVRALAEVLERLLTETS
ncbi:MAG: allantoate amidohydrolase [Nocardioides sp.]|nr:allantoate amidohydrolase [Nocardioides sp.]